MRLCLVAAGAGFTVAISALLAVPLAAQTATQTATQTVTSIGSVRDRLHDSDQWRAVEAHLPDPKTAGPKELENQADILRARRFPEDALDYYRYALDRGGRPAPLLNKMGLTELEMRNVVLARGYFTRAVKLNKKDAEGWNNLGAVEYLDGASASAVSDYKKALKLNRREAVFHANLATAYFEQKDFKGARREIAAAMKLDPEVFERKLGGGGVAAHLLSSDDRARFSFEMAKLYARNGLEDDMLHSLAMASEAGMDVQREMRKDATLARFELDPRVVVLVHNAQALRAGRNGTASAAAGAGALPETRPVVE